jgi:uncharacterized membrane protein
MKCSITILYWKLYELFSRVFFSLFGLFSYFIYALIPINFSLRLIYWQYSLKKGLFFQNKIGRYADLNSYGTLNTTETTQPL